VVLDILEFLLHNIVRGGSMWAEEEAIGMGAEFIIALIESVSAEREVAKMIGLPVCPLLELLSVDKEVLSGPEILAINALRMDIWLLISPAISPIWVFTFPNWVDISSRNPTIWLLIDSTSSVKHVSIASIRSGRSVMVSEELWIAGALKASAAPKVSVDAL